MKDRCQVGEHLLSWVQDLESFASSNALKDLLVLKGEAAQLSGLSQGWQSLKSKLDLVDVRFYICEMFYNYPKYIFFRKKPLIISAFGNTFQNYFRHFKENSSNVQL